jgi:hypothetical protein
VNAGPAYAITATISALDRPSASISGPDSKRSHSSPFTTRDNITAAARSGAARWLRREGVDHLKKWVRGRGSRTPSTSDVDLLVVEGDQACMGSSRRVEKS